MNALSGCSGALECQAAVTVWSICLIYMRRNIEMFVNMDQEY